MIYFYLAIEPMKVHGERVEGLVRPRRCICGIMNEKLCIFDDNVRGGPIINNLSIA